MTRGRPDPDKAAQRRDLLMAALEYGVSPIVAREAVSTTLMDKDETISLEAPNAEGT